MFRIAQHDSRQQLFPFSTLDRLAEYLGIAGVFVRSATTPAESFVSFEITSSFTLRNLRLLSSSEHAPKTMAHTETAAQKLSAINDLR